MRYAPFIAKSIALSLSEMATKPSNAKNRITIIRTEFSLFDIRSTGVQIGSGSYGNVEEVIVAGAVCAAKTLHDVFRDDSQIPAGDIRKATQRFLRECRLMSTLRHPNVVQFLGIAYLRNSQLPALIMERLLTSLHDFIAPDGRPPPRYFPLTLKVSILHNVSCGLAYLHGRSVIHRDLSARNVLLNSDMVAKIGDMGMARIVPHVRDPLTMTKAPGAWVYMPPEALENKPGTEKDDDDEEGKKSKYNASIDVFSFGVVAIFTLSQTFPCDLLAPTYREEGKLLPRTEFDRREVYMRKIYEYLHEQHPLVQMIKRCLDFPEARPIIGEVVDCLEGARAPGNAEDQGAEETMNRVELIQAIKVSQHEVRDLKKHLKRTEGFLMDTELQLQESKEKEEVVNTQLLRNKFDLFTTRCKIREQDKKLAEADEKFLDMKKKMTTMTRTKERELRTKERELIQARQKIQELTEQMALLKKTKNSELTKAWQEIQKLREEVTVLGETKESELASVHGELIEKEEQLKESEAILDNITNKITQFAVASGPGLASAMVNQETRVTVQLNDPDNRQSIIDLEVTAQLECVSNARKSTISLVTKVSPSEYEILYTPVNRGRHKIHICINKRDIHGSPFTVTAYPDPTQLKKPDKIIDDLPKSCGIAFKNEEEMIVTEYHSKHLSIISLKGGRPRHLSTTCNFPRGIAIDSDNNTFVCSKHKLQKLSSDGEVIKSIGTNSGKKNGEFNNPYGVTLHNNNLYVCDTDNNRIQVFTLDLGFVRSFGSQGKKFGEFYGPRDIQFDATGKMYVAEFGNKRVQVLDGDGSGIQEFGQEKLSGPSSLCISGDYTYVSDYTKNCVVVYDLSGKFVTSFGSKGHGAEEFNSPSFITAGPDGSIYVCDCHNDRVKVY